ncbi:MAG: hypothetical protein WD850_00695 [Candidatus Spechtbacterales bacterium]
MKLSGSRRILTAGVILLCVLDGLLFVVLQRLDSSQASDVSGPLYKTLTVEQLKVLAPDPFVYLHNNLEEIVLYQDADGALHLTREAFRQGMIDRFGCHTLAHEIGHHAASEGHFEHIELHISDANINFCGGGFMHGVEGGLAESGHPGFREDLYYFCTLALPVATTYAACYHGAGHAFVDRSQDFPEALQLCDTLITDERITATACYQGVFSEHIERMQREGVENSELLGFCASIRQALQNICALELNGLNITPASTNAVVEETLKICVYNDYPATVKTGCLESVSWAAADRDVWQRGKIVLLPVIFNFPQEFRRVYIVATTNRMKEHLKDGTVNTNSSFCQAFPSQDDQQFCRERILTKDNRAFTHTAFP